jgi:hypothetical protein
MISVLLLVLVSAHLAYTLQLFFQPNMIFHWFWQLLDGWYNRGGFWRFISKPLGLCPLCQMPYFVLIFAYVFGVSDWAIVFFALVSVTPYYQLLVRWTN